MPAKFLCIDHGHAGYTAEKFRCRYWMTPVKIVPTAMTQPAMMMSVNAVVARPARPRAHPTTSEPEMSSHAWNHSTVLAVWGLTMTVNSVVNW